jgi:hypothetical protein
MIIQLTDEQAEQMVIDYIIYDYGHAVYEQNTEISDLLLRVLEFYGVPETEAKASCGIE